MHSTFWVWEDFFFMECDVWIKAIYVNFFFNLCNKCKSICEIQMINICFKAKYSGKSSDAYWFTFRYFSIGCYIQIQLCTTQCKVFHIQQILYTQTFRFLSYIIHLQAFFPHSLSNIKFNTLNRIDGVNRILVFFLF